MASVHLGLGVEGVLTCMSFCGHDESQWPGCFKNPGRRSRKQVIGSECGTEPKGFLVEARSRAQRKRLEERDGRC